MAPLCTLFDSPYPHICPCWARWWNFFAPFMLFGVIVCNAHIAHNHKTQVLNEASALVFFSPCSFQQRRGSFRCKRQERGRGGGRQSAVHMQSEILTWPVAGDCPCGGGVQWSSLSLTWSHHLQKKNWQQYREGVDRRDDKRDK